MPFIAWSTLSWTEAEAYGRDGSAAGLIPLGAIEQHGPHLPLATDSLIVESLARAVAGQLAEPVLVTPVITGGLSEHHVGFPGTMTLDSTTFEATILALIEAFERTGVHRVALISAHGGNFGFMERFASEQAAREGTRIVAFSNLAAYFTEMFDAAQDTGVEPPPSDIHAGAIETGLAQHLFPELVREGWSEVAGFVDASPGLAERVLQDGVRGVSATGVLGDPSLASAALGAAVFERLRDAIARSLVAELGLTPAPAPLPS